MKPYKTKQQRDSVQFFLDTWFLAIILICIILGADAFSEWGAAAISFIIDQILGD